MSRRLGPDAMWPSIGLGACTVVGLALGAAAVPSAWPALLVLAAAQLAVTAFGLVAARRPVWWAVSVAAVSLGPGVVDPRLSFLVHSGAVPWISLGTAFAALTLYRRAETWLMIGTGTTALIISSASLVVANVRAGVPPTSAVLAASVPFLIGMLLAQLFHLRDARVDRLRRPEPTSTPDGSPTAPGTADANQRALTIVALRCDELATSTEDAAARRAATDLRDVARRALAGPGAHEYSVARIEVHSLAPGNLAPGSTGPGTTAPGTAAPARSAVASPPAAAAPPTAAAPPAVASPSAAAGVAAPRTAAPVLPDREREILRLVATGASNAAIARSLYLSEATVKQYVSRLMRRFDRDNRTQLALMAVRWFDAP